MFGIEDLTLQKRSAPTEMHLRLPNLKKLQKRQQTNWMTTIELQKKTKAIYLEKYVFDKSQKTTLPPLPEDADGFNKYLEGYKKLLEVEKAAVEHL